MLIMRLQWHKKARALNWNPGHAMPTLTATYANATLACHSVSQSVRLSVNLTVSFLLLPPRRLSANERTPRQKGCANPVQRNACGRTYDSSKRQRNH